MAIIEKSRTIRPTTHDESDPYRVHCDDVTPGDILQINIKHESDSNFDMLFGFGYNELYGKNSIHFIFKQNQIEWLGGIQPQRIR